MGVLTNFESTWLIEQHLGFVVWNILHGADFHLSTIAVLVVDNVRAQVLRRGNILQNNCITSVHWKTLAVLSVLGGFGLDTPHSIVGFTCEKWHFLITRVTSIHHGRNWQTLQVERLIEEFINCLQVQVLSEPDSAVETVLLTIRPDNFEDRSSIRSTFSGGCNRVSLICGDQSLVWVSNHDALSAQTLNHRTITVVECTVRSQCQGNLKEEYE